MWKKNGFSKRVYKDGDSYLATLNSTKKVFHWFAQNDGKPGYEAQEFLELMEASDYEKVEV